MKYSKGLIAFVNDQAKQDKWTEINANDKGLDEFLNEVGAANKFKKDFWWNGRLFTFHPEEYEKFGIKVELRNTPWGKMPSVKTPMFNKMLENL